MKNVWFKLTVKKVMEITYEEKHSLEFWDHWDQALHAKTKLRPLESFPRIRELTYSQLSNRCCTDASL